MGISIKHFVDAEKLKEHTAFTEADIDSAMMDHASTYAHYGQQASDALFQMERVKLILEVTEAKTAQRMRDEAAVSGEKLSEKAIESKLLTVAELIALRKAYIEAKAQNDLARSALEAMKQRRDMLIQTGVRMREEREGEVRVSGNRNSDADARRVAKERTKELAG